MTLSSLLSLGSPSSVLELSVSLVSRPLREPSQGPTRSLLKPCLALPLPLPPEIHQLIAAGVDRSKVVAYEARKEVGGLWFVLSAFAPVESQRAELTGQPSSPPLFPPGRLSLRRESARSGLVRLGWPFLRPSPRGRTRHSLRRPYTRRFGPTCPRLCACSVPLTPHLPHPSPLSLS